MYRRTSCCLALLGLVLFCSASVSAAAARDDVEEFNAFLLPDTAFAVPNSFVEIRFEVDSTAHQFNAYEVTIQFDPTILSFDSVQEGSLMTGACANRFTYLTTTDSTVTYAHSLLCGGVSLDGPGVLSIYKFRANAFGVSPMTITSNPDRTFYDAGYYIWPNHPTYPRQVILHNDVVIVHDPTSDVPQGNGGDAGAVRSQSLLLRVFPNPLRSSDQLRLDVLPDGPLTVDLFDPGGARIRTWSGFVGTSGRVELPARFLIGSGGVAFSGAYFLQVRSGSRMGIARLAIIH